MDTRDTLKILAQKILSLSAKTDLNKLEKDLLRNYLLQMYDALDLGEQVAETGLPELGETMIPREKTVPTIDEIGTQPDSLPEEEEEEELVEERVKEEPPKEEPSSLFTTPAADEKAEEPVAEEELKETPPEEASPSAETQEHKEEKVEEGTLHERISRAQEKNTLADKLMYTPIDNIKAHITLNKKVAFIIGLFNQESDDYNKAIDQLNTADNLQEALDHFHVLRNRYNWTPDNELMKELDMLVRRRYSQGS